MCIFRLRRLAFVAFSVSISLLLLLIITSVVTLASHPQRRDQYSSDPRSSERAAPNVQALPAGIGARQVTSTNLTLNIVSSPWAVLDHNDPDGSSGEVPNTFVVEAVITNTGGTTATDLSVVLDYNEDLLHGWTLQPGELPERNIERLGPGDAYHAYWLAKYSTVIGTGHQYTVTAGAANANPVASSDNAYGNPAAGQTVRTSAFRSNAVSSVSQTSVDTYVGVLFTITVDYDLGNNPHMVTFSPVGNEDFDASALRLIASSVRLYDDAGVAEQLIYDRLYYPTLPALADNATVVYTFLALTPSIERLCSYAGVGLSNDVYDQFFCDASRGTVVPITSTLSLSFTKRVDRAIAEQGEVLIYTLRYTNTSGVPLSYVWIWDMIDQNVGSIITPSITPPAHPGETSDDRVAWYLGSVQSDESGTLGFSFLIDGNGADLGDGTLVVNTAHYGINQGRVPVESAASQTVTTVIQAPAISVAKSDGLTWANPDEPLTYSLRITNSGSIPASGVLITDMLPNHVIYTSDTATPRETGRAGQVLSWDDLGPIPPGGGVVAITLPVTVNSPLDNGTVLTNNLLVHYENQGGHVFDTAIATDTTTVEAPDLSISKRAYPDPVLVGQLITYTLYYTNSGAEVASNVMITDIVPISTTYDDCRGGSACDEVAGTVTWSLDSVPPGVAGNVGYSVRVSDTLATGDEIWNETYGIVSDHARAVLGAPISTTVSRESAYLDGWAFVDANGDGARNPSEALVPGVAITLSSASVLTSTTTDGGGYYRFRLEYQDPIEVTSQVPSAHFRTTPGTVFLDSQYGITRTVDFGFAPTDAGFGIIFGTVFEDANRDAARGIGENGISGVTITSALAVTPAVTSNAWGQYTLRYAQSGAVTVTETDPTSFVSTTPNEVNTDAVMNSPGPSPVDFGDFRGVRITGRVFDDINVNGANDDGLFVSGATVSSSDAHFSTDSSGAYVLFVAADTAPIVITEADPAGYVSTNAVPGAGMTRQDAGTLIIPSPLAGSIYAGGDFGDVQATAAVTLSGSVWNDNGAGGGYLANGLRDGAEPDLAGAIVQLSSGMTQTTSGDGRFLLYAPANQVITVTETNPDGYVSTNALPGTAAVKLNADTLRVTAQEPGATSEDHLFGDVSASSAAVITGTVFDDANENGVPDAGEAGLAGITLTLTFSGGQAISLVTGPAGSYQFAVAAGIDVRVTSSGPMGGYYPTTPESIIIRPPTSGVFPNVDFGYSDDTGVAVIFGLVYDDVNGDGEQDIGEPGLAGAGLALNGTDMIATGGNGLITGTFSFSVPQAGTWSLRESNPPGYRSTTPDEINIRIDLGQSYYVEFGDTARPDTASIYGTVFEDIDGDGEQDPDEVGLGGVVISATIGGRVVTATTQAYGQYGYGFATADAGFHTFTEGDPALLNYRSTTPDRVILDVVLGQSYLVNFGDTPIGNTISNIMGTVFNDASGDGTQNPGEPGLENVAVSLSNGNTTTTDIAGRYSLAVSQTGFVRVAEHDPLGYHSTTPNTVTVSVELSQHYTVDFGDSNRTAGSSIYGTVFRDTDVNGWWDLSDPGLGGVTVTLSGSAEANITNEWGQFTFLVGSAGTYTITESDLPGYISTNAIPGDPTGVKVDNNRLRVNVVLGSDPGNNLFGDALATHVITVSGSVWDDNGDGGGIPGDGVWNGAEPGLAGAHVSLSSGLSQLTKADGTFSLYAPPAAVITVTEVNPFDFLSTNALPGNDAIKIDNDTLQVMNTLAGGESSTGNLFGDILSPVCTCAPDQYEEDDDWTDAKFLASGDSQKQTHDFCDDATDWMTFTTEANSTYTITTSAWGEHADTFLSVFDTDGSTLLVANDDFEGSTDFSSRVVWQAPTSDGYFLRVTNRAGLFGCSTDYDVWINVEVDRFIYLPVIVQGYSSSTRQAP